MRGPQPPSGLGPAPGLALVALTATAAFSLDRLFSDQSWVGHVFLALAVSHGLAWGCRRLGLGIGASAVIAAAGLVAFAAWVLFPATTTFGLPGSTTWRTASDDLARAWREFGEVRAPVEPLRGFVLAAVAGTWLAAFIADWAAFRLAAPFEATVPSFTMFLFSSALGADRHVALAAGLYLAAVLSFLLLHTAARGSESSAWFASRVRGGPRAIVRGGASLGLVTLAAALVLGPAVPGAGDPPMLDWRDRNDGDGSRVTISPLVDIRGRLVDQSDVEVFTVRAATRSYWRLTSLDSFDGQVWGSRGSYRDAAGELAGELPRRVRADQAVQEFDIAALATIWLPAAYRPEQYAGPPGVSFDPESGSLLTEGATADGMRYRILSDLPRVTAGLLGRAGQDVPGDVAERYLALPDDFPSSVAAVARQVAGRPSTPYEQARALQDWFRANFTYDLSVPPGHGAGAIQAFLRSRRGYCEQFAGAYAAMARALGLPARVAVGFTPGELEADGRYHVTGRNAHAWPEVWFADLGWVAFEPTPGRGAPGAQGYTGVPEQQVAAGEDPTVATTVPSATATTTAGAEDREQPTRRNENEVEVGDIDVSQSGRSPWPRRLRAVALVVAVTAAAWAGGVPLLLALRRRRRRRAAVTPTDRTLLAWHEATEALATAGTRPRPSETPVEFARRVPAAADLDPELLADLARDTTAAAYAPDGVAGETAARAEQAAGTVVATLVAREPRRRRLLRHLDPRPLLGRDRSAA